MFDTHVNLHAEAFDEDRDAMMARAREAGVTRFLAICDRIANADRVAALAQAEPDVWASVGAHPHYAKDHTELTVEDLVARAAHPKVVAIGETGLDQYYGHSPLDVQMQVFGVHIAAAQRTGLPVIIHTREADAQTADMLEQAHVRAPFGMLLHCYTGGADLAQRALKLGAFVSASGIVSFNSAKDVRAVLADIPLDRLLVETDCPYLAPIPMRGRRNEPAYLPHVIAALAKLLQREPDEVARVTHENALRLFSKVGAG
jgi:TatD DNase family protein